SAVLRNSLINDECMGRFLWADRLATSTKDSIGSNFQSSAPRQAQSSLTQSIVYLLCKKLLPIFEFVAKIAAG
ncbi:MAG TPA: hypothetical protein VK475_11265, partial [Pyrinomonadaceae bacterium]|nr:hypothetical protein [Pyrinomonadaceae bacterium]